MVISLSPETQKLIEERMKHGGYATPDDVVRAGLSSLEQQQNSGEFETGELDRLLADGENSGAPLDGEQVLAELRELRSRHSNKAG
jgi:putative addiction module CopG family antidote